MNTFLVTIEEKMTQYYVSQRIELQTFLAVKRLMAETERLLQCHVGNPSKQTSIIALFSQKIVEILQPI